MRKTFLFTFFATITLLAFLSPSIFANNSVLPTVTPTTVVATPTSEIPHYPISTTVPVPPLVYTIPHTLNVTVDFSELNQIQFIDTDVLAYRQWGNLYIHHLITQTTQLALDGNDIMSFDWSPARRQFVIIRDGQLLLVDEAGNLVEDLSAVLAEPDSGFEVPSCQKHDELIEADSYQIKNATWGFDENSVQFTYEVLDKCFYSHLWQFNIDTYESILVDSSNDPVWDWLDDQTLVSSAYYGGGSRVFSIIDVPNDRTIFRVDAWGTTPVGSPDGSRLAVAVHDLRKLLVFDTASGQQIFEHDFGNENPNEDAIVSVINWSHSGRYMMLYVTKGIRNNFGGTENLTVIVDIDTGEFWPLFAHYNHHIPSIIWLPDREQALMFERQDNTTSMSRLLPEIQQIVPMGKITETLWSPDIWPGDNRYLPIKEGRTIYDPANPTPYWNDTTAGIWLWDRQEGGLPYPIYQVTPLVQDDNSYYRGDAGISTLILSPDETWVVFSQQVGWSVSDSPYYTDITLQAIHLPSGEHHQITKWSPPEIR